VQVFRLCRAAFKALDGEGARLWGGRWNSPGSPVVYTSGSLALAAMEYLIHVDPSDVPGDLTALTIEFPDTLSMGTVANSALPTGWELPTDLVACQAIGDDWVKAGAVAVLKVPAAAVPEEYNYLLNPRHSSANNVAIVAERPFVYDPRLLSG
jgi:RES domain-containing protein